MADSGYALREQRNYTWKCLKSIGWGFGGCNMGCDHCYNASTFISQMQSFPELRAIADLICPFIDSINFGTGEFDFNANAVQLARYINNFYPHVKLAITTNGTSILLLRPEEVKKIFHDVDVSLDFPNPEEHNRFRKHPMAWEFVQTSLMILKNLGMERSIVTCVTSRHTDDHIRQMLSFAQEYGASWRTNWFRLTGRGKEHLRITADRFWGVIKLLAQEGWLFECLSDPLLASLLGRPDKNPVHGCACAKLSCRIQTDSTVTPCVYLKGQEWSGGSILQDGKLIEGNRFSIPINTLEKIYESDRFRAVRERFPDRCKECKYGETCRGGCSSRAFLHSGGLDQLDDFCPFITMEREKAEDMLSEIRSLAQIIDGTGKVHDGYLCTMIVNQPPIVKLGC